jgi:two-component system nitrate/nitrite sensor histidine kinase NarX
VIPPRNTGPEGLSPSSRAEGSRPARGLFAAGPLGTPLAALVFVLLLLAPTGVLIAHFPAYAGLLVAVQGALAFAALLLVVILVLAIRRQALEPLARLRNWTRQMRNGDFSARVPEPRAGEFAELARDINELGTALQVCSRDMEAQVQKQTERLAQKTRSLEILYDVAASINVSRDLDELLQRFLHTLKDITNARAASVRLLTADGQMRLVGSVGLDPEIVETEHLLPADSCLCASAFTEGEIRVQDDVRDCAQVIGRSFFGDDKVRMIAIPLGYRGRPVGVYNLFVDDEGSIASEDLRGLLTSIGRHLGTAIEKARLDAEATRLSIMEERTRLAHDLHDSLAQTLASLRFQVRVLDETLHQGVESAVWQELERVENSLDEAYAELRALIGQFRNPAGQRGLVPAIEEAVKRFRRETGSHIFLQNAWGESRFPADIEMQILRIVQESLNNARKHSKAHTVRVMLARESDGSFSLLVEDDGVGFDSPVLEGPPGEHIGLSIMRDRARQLGGELRIESDPGEGTRVLLSFPAPSGENEALALRRAAK